MAIDERSDLLHDLVLPIVLFSALGGMTWAVRGCSGYGAMMGCIFAGVTWGAAWWFIARQPGPDQVRRYTSGWIVLALTVGIGISGARGWMQWPSFFEGRLQTNYGLGEYVPISRAYGFVWLFIAGVPWAGIGACMLAWCGSVRTTRWWHWTLRIACGVGAACIARYLFEACPEFFMPLYKSMKSQYHDFEANPNLRRLTNDNRAAITHLGLYLGFLVYEIIRRDWKNVTLITTVGVLNGIAWSLLQNWTWAPSVWPEAHFNFWRCWESSGGISIGIAYGVAYYLVNRPVPEARRVELRSLLTNVRPNLERFGLYLGLILGLGLSIKNGLKGWANIYLGHEDYWNNWLSWILFPLMTVGIVGSARWVLDNNLPRDYKGDLFPRAYGVMWLVLITQNILAQLVTGPLSDRNELTFNVYYLVLFAISGVIVRHYHVRGRTSLPA